MRTDDYKSIANQERLIDTLAGKTWASFYDMRRASDAPSTNALAALLGSLAQEKRITLSVQRDGWHVERSPARTASHGARRRTLTATRLPLGTRWGTGKYLRRQEP